MHWQARVCSQKRRRRRRRGKKIKWKFKVKLMLSSIKAIRTAHISNMSTSRACWVWITWRLPPLSPPSLPPLPHHPRVSCNKTLSGKHGANVYRKLLIHSWANCVWEKLMKRRMASRCNFIFSLALKAQCFRFSGTWWWVSIGNSTFFGVGWGGL